jgi:hypothetical protein
MLALFMREERKIEKTKKRKNQRQFKLVKFLQFEENFDRCGEALGSYLLC